jgi:hypothetical protein
VEVAEHQAWLKKYVQGSAVQCGAVPRLLCWGLPVQWPLPVVKDPWREHAQRFFFLAVVLGLVGCFPLATCVWVAWCLTRWYRAARPVHGLVYVVWALFRLGASGHNNTCLLDGISFF